MWNKIKWFLQKLKKFTIYFVQILLIISFGSFLIVTNQKNNEKLAKDTQSQPKLSETFVSIEKDGNIEVFLDLDNGCKYYKGFGLKYKNDGITTDCELKYVDEYKTKNKK